MSVSAATPLPCLRGPGNFPVWRIHDLRCSPGADDRSSGPAEDTVVGADTASTPAARPAHGVVESRERCLLERSLFLIGEKCLIGELIRAFQWRQDVAAAPNSLQVGLSPRGLRRGPRVHSGGRASAASTLIEPDRRGVPTRATRLPDRPPTYSAVRSVDDSSRPPVRAAHDPVGLATPVCGSRCDPGLDTAGYASALSRFNSRATMMVSPGSTVFRTSGWGSVGDTISLARGEIAVEPLDHRADVVGRARHTPERVVVATTWNTEQRHRNPSLFRRLAASSRPGQRERCHQRPREASATGGSSADTCVIGDASA